MRKREVAAYRAENDILDGQNNSALATQQFVGTFERTHPGQGGQGAGRGSAQSVQSLLDSGASIDTVPEILSSGLIQRLREQQVTLKSEIADLVDHAPRQSSRAEGLRSQLNDLDIQIRNEAEKILKSFQTEARTAALREQELIASLNGLKPKSSRVGDEEVGLRGAGT